MRVWRAFSTDDRLLDPTEERTPTWWDTSLAGLYAQVRAAVRETAGALLDRCKDPEVVAITYGAEGALEAQARRPYEFTLDRFDVEWPLDRVRFLRILRGAYPGDRTALGEVTFDHHGRVMKEAA